MARAPEGSALFVSDDERRAFLARLGTVRLEEDLEPHAVTLMTTHYHLLVRDVRGRLSQGIRRLHRGFTEDAERLSGRDGQLFRGRFKSKRVTDERYLTELLRYIHANPVEAGLVQDAADWPWSSHGVWMRGQSTPWLEMGFFRDYLGKDSPEMRETLHKWVHARVGQPPPPGLAAA